MPCLLWQSVDRMIKLHFIANIKHAVCNGMHFLQRSFLKIPDDLPLCRGATDLSLYIRTKKCRPTL